MGRKKERVINGKVFPDREYQHYLIAALKAQPDDVVSSADWCCRFFGDPDWDCVEARDAVYRKLLQMASGKKARIERSDRGVFRVKKVYDVHGLDGVHELEKVVTAFLKENGGLARRRDVMDHLAVSHRGEAISVDHTLARSHRIRKDFNLPDRDPVDAMPENRAAPLSDVVGKHVPEMRVQPRRYRLARLKGLLNLHPDEIHRLVLEGRWVGRFIGLSFWVQSNAGETTALDSSKEVDAFLRNVGRIAQLMRERHGYTIDEIVDRQGVREALNAAAFRYTRKEPQLRRLAGENTRAGTDADAHELRVLLYARFEGGEDEQGQDLYRVRAHTSMRTDFYEALAGVYALDPVAFSRGLLMPAVAEDRDNPWGGFFESIMADDGIDEDLAAEDDDDAEEGPVD